VRPRRSLKSHCLCFGWLPWRLRPVFLTPDTAPDGSRSTFPLAVHGSSAGRANCARNDRLTPLQSRKIAGNHRKQRRVVCGLRFTVVHVAPRRSPGALRLALFSPTGARVPPTRRMYIRCRGRSCLPLLISFPVEAGGTRPGAHRPHSA